MRRNRALSSSEYELIRARQRLLPLSADLAKQADRLIANSAVAAAFASNLDASLRSTVESRLAAAIFGGAGSEKRQRMPSLQSSKLNQLTELFREHRGDAKWLEELLFELENRSSQAAKKLQAQVESRLAILKEIPQPKASPSKPTRRRPEPRMVPKPEAEEGELRSTDESGLAAAIFGGASLEKPHRTPSRQSRRMAAIRVRFATGQQSAATDSKDRKCFPVLWSDKEFEDVVRVLRDDPHLRKLLGRRPDIAPLLYSDELGSRRDAIADTDLLVVNAEALVVEPVRVRVELIVSLADGYGSSRDSVHRALNERNRELAVRVVNILYEVAWARYFGRPVIWYLPSRFGERDALIRAQRKIAQTLGVLAQHNYVPLFKWQRLKASQRFMPEDYRRLLADVPGPCVAGAMPLREQLLLALSDLSEFHSGKAAPTAAETRSFGRGHVG
jgi:hypothetical protein